ncbi:NAD(P)H-dependent oxidoreductase [Candidatus Peregrinibacteria bacterium]|nr:MAG: NAD(P)H-dependent oxidoreductase [Candidatus Peregrinibacteria bacterium]
MKTKTILALYCAPNKDSNSATLLDYFCEGAASKGVQISKLYLYDLHLPYFDYNNRLAEPADARENVDLRKIEALMMSSQALVIASPVWDFSVPAILKNFMDRISYFARVYKHQDSMRKQPNLDHLDCFYIFTTGAPWYGWLFDSLAYFHTKLTFWYFGSKNRGLLRAHGCGNGSTNVVKGRPALLAKARKKGERFASKYLIQE